VTRPIASLLEKAQLPEPHDDPRFQAALTHPSSATRPHYERLEYLGDAVLKLVVSEWLFQRTPPLSEGVMTQVRAQAVSDETLAVAARALDLGPYLILGASEKRSGGREKTSILASAFEALIGAIYEVHGLSIAAQFLKTFLGPEFQRASLSAGRDNYKAVLQEWTQKHHQCLPIYETLENATHGSHAPVFTVEVVLQGQVLARATGGSKRQASQRAAALALEALTSGEELKP